VLPAPPLLDDDNGGTTPAVALLEPFSTGAIFLVYNYRAKSWVSWTINNNFFSPQRKQNNATTQNPPSRSVLLGAWGQKRKKVCLVVCCLCLHMYVWVFFFSRLSVDKNTTHNKLSSTLFLTGSTRRQRKVREVERERGFTWSRRVILRNGLV
jgi:hypothetical protein